MWVRRTLAEIAEVERKHNLSRFYPVPAFLMAFGIACMDTLFRWGGWRGKLVPPGNPIPFLDALSGFPLALIIGFALIYVWRIFFRNRIPSDGVLICTKCFESAASDAPPRCLCGGSREYLYFWTWKREENAAPVVNPERKLDHP